MPNKAIRFTFMTGLNSPYGMALVGNTLYIADTDNHRVVEETPGGGGWGKLRPD